MLIVCDLNDEFTKTWEESAVNLCKSTFVLLNDSFVRIGAS